jgi:hypothetical protein
VGLASSVGKQWKRRMSARRIRQITLELNQLAIERTMEEERRRERERELLRELIQIPRESAS